MNNNIRCYARNSNLVYPKTVQYSCSIERPPTRVAYHLCQLALLAGIVVIVLAIAFEAVL